MKKLFLFLVITAMVATTAVAQETKEKSGPDQKSTVEQKDAKKSTDMKAARADWEKKIKDELKFTPEQSAKFDALNKEYNEKIEAAVQDASLDKDAQKEKKMALKKEKEGKFFEILTPEQQIAYKELIEKKKKEMSEKPQGNN
jgi:Spy/CpxP family protein refolding chaperone